jgi:virginiamycin A acetyltransferase
MLHAEDRYPLQINGAILPSVVYLKHFISKAHIEVGDYTYYHDEAGATNFENTNILYDAQGMGLQLSIGKFCQIATATKFMCPYGEHHTNSFTTYPLFWKDQHTTISMPSRQYFHDKGPTLVGHDVWFGYDSLIMPGITIGSGAIIASRAVVTQNVPAYAIVGGNPAKIIRMRFADATIEQLLQLEWWHWPIALIEANYQGLLNCDLATLQRVKPNA